MSLRQRSCDVRFQLESHVPLGKSQPFESVSDGTLLLLVFLAVFGKDHRNITRLSDCFFCRRKKMLHSWKFYETTPMFDSHKIFVG